MRAAASAFFDRVLVKRLCAPRNIVPGRNGAAKRRHRLPHAKPRRLVGDQPRERLSKSRRVVRRHEMPMYVLFEKLGESAEPGGDDGLAVAERSKENAARFDLAIGKDKDRRAREMLRQRLFGQEAKINFERTRNA